MSQSFNAWVSLLPRCLGYEGQCDGDLEGEEHNAHCPMFGKKPATLQDAFNAGRASLESELASAVAEARLLALEEAARLACHWCRAKKDHPTCVRLAQEIRSLTTMRLPHSPSRKLLWRANEAD